MLLGKYGCVAGLALVLLMGCGGGAPGAAEGPEHVISEFLAAIKKGDDQSASALLTAVARQKTTEMEMVVAPPGSDTATFKVLESEIEGGEAQVGTDWTDLDADGKPKTDRIVWLLRQEGDTWRIHGMATRVFPDLAPIMLNFEDPVDMMRKQQQAEEEIARRDAQTAGAASDAGAEPPATIR